MEKLPPADTLRSDVNLFAQCYHFGRCKKGEEAPVNKHILAKFAKVKLYLDIGGCSNIKNDARDIKALMTVPLIQAASRAMYTIDKEDSTDGASQGQAAAYAAALLPLIHQVWVKSSLVDSPYPYNVCTSFISVWGRKQQNNRSRHDAWKSASGKLRSCQGSLRKMLRRAWCVVPGRRRLD